jgi:hypothetical protein
VSVGASPSVWHAARHSVKREDVPNTRFRRSTELRDVRPELRHWISSAALIDRALVGLGIAIALGSAAFATGMIIRERPVPLSSAQSPVPVTGDDRVASSRVAPSAKREDERAGSIPEPARGGDPTYSWRTEPFAEDRRDDDVAPGPTASSYVLRYADAGAALLQGPDGTLVVTRGSVVPDAGRVRSIETRTGRWVVVTAHGTIEGPSM